MHRRQRPAAATTRAHHHGRSRQWTPWRFAPTRPTRCRSTRANRTAENRTTPALDARSPAMVRVRARRDSLRPAPAHRATRTVRLRTSGTTSKAPRAPSRPKPVIASLSSVALLSPVASLSSTARPLLAARVRAIRHVHFHAYDAAPPPGAAAASAPSASLDLLDLVIHASFWMSSERKPQFATGHHAIVQDARRLRRAYSSSASASRSRTNTPRPRVDSR